MEKYCRAGQAKCDNIAHAHCVLDTEGYKLTLRIGDTGGTNAHQCFVNTYLACVVKCWDFDRVSADVAAGCDYCISNQQGE